MGQRGIPVAGELAMRQAFDRSTRYEIAFWQMAFTRGAVDHSQGYQRDSFG
jgi:hypothetical protein